MRKPLKKLVTHIFDHAADVTSLSASQDMFVSTADVAYMYNKVAPVWETIGTTDGNIGSLECVNTLCATATSIYNVNTLECVEGQCEISDPVTTTGVVKLSRDGKTFVRKSETGYHLHNVNGTLIGDLDYPYRYAKIRYAPNGDFLCMMAYPLLFCYDAETSEQTVGHARLDTVPIEKQYFDVTQRGSYTPMDGHCEPKYIPYVKRGIGYCPGLTEDKPGGVTGTPAQKRMACYEYCFEKKKLSFTAVGFYVDRAYNNTEYAKFIDGEKVYFNTEFPIPIPEQNTCGCEYEDVDECTTAGDYDSFKRYMRYDFAAAETHVDLTQEECTRECYDLYGGFATMTDTGCFCSMREPCNSSGTTYVPNPDATTNTDVHFDISGDSLSMFVGTSYMEYEYSDSPPRFYCPDGSSIRRACVNSANPDCPNCPGVDNYHLGNDIENYQYLKFHKNIVREYSFSDGQVVKEMSTIDKPVGCSDDVQRLRGRSHVDRDGVLSVQEIVGFDAGGGGDCGLGRR